MPTSFTFNYVTKNWIEHPSNEEYNSDGERVMGESSEESGESSGQDVVEDEGEEEDDSCYEEEDSSLDMIAEEAESSEGFKCALRKMTKDQLIELIVASEWRTTLGVHFESLPAHVHAMQFGFSSLAVMENLSKEVGKFAKHPTKRSSNKYIYDVAFRITLLMLRKGDSDQFLYFLLPPKCRSGRSTNKFDRARSLRRWYDIILQGIIEWGESIEIIQWLSPQEWQADTATVPSFNDEFPNTLIYHVDGTVFPTYCPTCPLYAKALWNSKHEIHAFQV